MCSISFMAAINQTVHNPVWSLFDHSFLYRGVSSHVCISKQNKLNVNVQYSKQITFACVCGGGEMIIPCLTYFQLVAAQALDNR